MTNLCNHWAFRSTSEDADLEKSLDVYKPYKEEIPPSPKATRKDLQEFVKEYPEYEENVFMHGGGSVKLYLDYNDLVEIPKAIIEKLATNVTFLDVSSNKISLLYFLKHFPNLKTFLCAGNQLTSYISIPYTPSLREVHFNSCEITDLTVFLGKLSVACPNLESISLMGNPCPYDCFSEDREKYINLRAYAVSLFPNLQSFDESPVSEREMQFGELVQTFENSEESLLVVSVVKVTKMNFWRRAYAFILQLFRIRRNPY